MSEEKWVYMKIKLSTKALLVQRKSEIMAAGIIIAEQQLADIVLADALSNKEIVLALIENSL